MRRGGHGAAGALLVVSGCVDLDPMRVQARDGAFVANPYFADARSMRPRVPGTVVREWYFQEAAFAPRGSPDGGWVDVDRLPVPFTRDVLLEGRAHFETWCAPCHGLLGDGQSIVGQNMRERPPPTLYGEAHMHPMHAEGGAPPDAGAAVLPVSPGWDALPHPPGFYYSVITGGYGLMPSYADALTPEARWKVVAWLRVLAYSQRAPLSAAPDDVRAALQQTAPGGTP
ncbi:ABC-type Fe3+ transport system protein [Myxococcus hansupus]|uniref:ABC-type Fe3+ transport system protein n=1 Tax=Pseudomyxococcus hansupus TaxID=1297742 RepID=A0A0H4WTJ8_9BACT|nr:c-type cytochrome [Myxococcus hansupus]AKQ66129.1 ABC-type Fe3+ transport system protein [Myxococcus hansupus]